MQFKLGLTILVIALANSALTKYKIVDFSDHNPHEKQTGVRRFSVVGASESNVEEIMQQMNSQGRLAVKPNGSAILDGYCNRCFKEVNDHWFSCTEKWCGEADNTVTSFVAQALGQVNLQTVYETNADGEFKVGNTSNGIYVMLVAN